MENNRLIVADEKTGTCGETIGDIKSERDVDKGER